MDELQLLLDLHQDGPRQGPGGDRETRLAVELSGLKHVSDLKIADIGCGTGASTLVLARELDAHITAVDFLPDRKQKWPLASAPWSDGFSFVAPADHFGERGRNGFGLADMCGNVWEVVLDHFDPTGGHEELHLTTGNYRPVCRGGNYFDVPGNARCAVRLGLAGPNYSDSRDGFRICLGPTRNVER